MSPHNVFALTHLGLLDLSQNYLIGLSCDSIVAGDFGLFKERMSPKFEVRAGAYVRYSGCSSVSILSAVLEHVV